jgi:hypothetical protein
MDERWYRDAPDRRADRERRAAQEARLRAADWPAATDEPEWSQPTAISRPLRAHERAYGHPPHGYTVPRIDDSLPEVYVPASMTPTRRVAPAWRRRAAQISAFHPVFDDFPETEPSLPVARAYPAPARRRWLGARLGMWCVRRWHAGPTSRALLVAGLTALLFACCAPGAIIARSTYAASDGYHHLMQIDALINQEGAAGLVNPANQAFLHDQLAAAHADFVTLGQMLALTGPLQGFSGTAQNLARLTRLAVDLTGGGQALLDVATTTLAPLLIDPFAQRVGAALSPTTLSVAHARLAVAQAQLDDAAALAPTISTAGLPGSFGASGKLSALLAKVGDAARLTRYFNLLLDAAPQLLGVGTPATYLLLAMDRSELRTGGGFTGNYGILTITSAHLQGAKLQDTYLLDAAYFARTGQQPPARYPWWPYRNGSAVYGWGLRDANLSPDFPTNARTALGIVRAVQSDPTLRDPYPIVGVIAITSVVMGQIITIGGGSLRLPEYPDHVITPQNLDDTIHCFQLGACRNETPFLQPGDGAPGDRKRFTAFLGQTLVDRVRHFSGGQLKAFMKLVFADLTSKDIQLYFTDAHAESVLQDAQLGGGIAPPSPDTLFVTDTNIGGNKANAFVTQHEEDLVTLLPDGSALHRLLIRTVYHRQGPLYEGSTGQTSYWEYRRVYFPGIARYLGSAGFAGGSGRHQLNATTASDTSGYKMTGAALSLDDGLSLGQCQPFPGGPASQPWDCAPQTRDVFIYWIVPHAWHAVGGKPVYTLLVQRQPGANVTLTVRLDASHIADGLPSLAPAALVQDYDTPDSAQPNGFTAMMTAAWAALTAHARPLYDGPLSQNTTVQWGG